MWSDAYAGPRTEAGPDPVSGESTMLIATRLWSDRIFIFGNNIKDVV